ncbi:MAG: iron-sulfur cluster assembly accessory protein [Nanoarchaeota archaeon]
MEQTQISGPVHKGMTLGEIVQKYPEAIDIMQERGLHCVGCGASYWETLEEGAVGHGWVGNELDEMITSINKVIGARVGIQESVSLQDEKTGHGGCASGGCGSSTSVLTMEKPNPGAVEIAHRDPESVLRLTPKAVQKAVEFMKAEGAEGYGLRVAVLPGGCAGYSYDLGFAQQPQPNDIILLTNGMKVFVDPDSVEYLKGTTLDFVESLHATGFKFDNPNAKSHCGCGSSFG